jgi:peroxiredoxin
MKLNFIYYLLISICLVPCDRNVPNTFTLEGEVDGLGDSTILVLSYLMLDNDKWTEVKDTAYVIDSKFSFKGNINELTAASLEFDDIVVRFLYLEPATMRLKLDKDRPWEYELSGTKAELENIVLREKLKPYEEEIYKELCIVRNIVEQINLHNEETSERDSLINILKINSTKRITLEKQKSQIQLNYILENKTSKIVPHLIYTMARWELVDIDTLKNAYDNLSEESKKTMLGKLAFGQIEQTERLANGKNIVAGSIAPDFSGIDFSGKKVQLSDLYSQSYVLLDFWASWCKPCLEQIPSMKRIQDDYAGKGLKIIGISLDEDKKRWTDAIEKYKLETWLQILSKPDSNGDYFSYDISDAYGVEYIPSYFLIDNQGKVVARWQHLGEEEISLLRNLLSNYK